MTLNWFSPLPPAPTAIASYTAALLPVLRECAHVVLWTDQGSWDRGIERLAPVRHYQPEDPPWGELNRADLSIYHIGNHASFHGGLWRVSCRQPGLVVLHDLCLQHLYVQHYRERGDRAAYVAAMARHYGAAGALAAAAFWLGDGFIDHAAPTYPLTPLAVHNALGVLVHTRAAFESVTGHNRVPVAWAPLPYAASPRRLGAMHSPDAQPPYRLITFGHIGSNRCLDAVLDALAGFSERERFRLEIYGSVWNAAAMRAHIHACGLDGLVALRGYVPDAELDAALERAHLAINLRYPTMGEASLSQLQIWDHALPSLVTRAGWYAQLPEDAVAFVQPGCEQRDVQAHLRAFLDDPRRFAHLGENGRRLLEARHTPRSYAQALVELSDRAQRFRPSAMAWRLAERAGVQLEAWIRPLGSSIPFRRVAEAIHALTSPAPQSDRHATAVGPPVASHDGAWTPKPDPRNG